MKHPAEVDVAVLILFFTRPEPLKKVFDAIRQARPSKLYLYQDGPRGPQDMAGIEACRQVVCDDEIDWECDVQRNYQTVNAGCDPSNFNAQKWAFSLSDKVVVFEDDSIPSVSFIRFCKEMLDRYEHDERIVMMMRCRPTCPTTISSLPSSPSGAGHRGAESLTNGTSTIPSWMTAITCISWRR